MTGTGRVQGELWGTRATAWAEHETQYLPVYNDAIRRLGIRAGTAVLDVGCGSGVFLRAASDAGSRVSGLDASERLLEIARARVPEANIRLGDLQFLPYEADAFDAVTSFNSFGSRPIRSRRCARPAASPGRALRSSRWSSGGPSAAR
jgi:SAM-dependent methyltransferase